MSYTPESPATKNSNGSIRVVSRAVCVFLLAALATGCGPSGTSVGETDSALEGKMASTGDTGSSEGAALGQKPTQDRTSGAGEGGAGLSGTILANHPIYSLVNGAAYSGRIVLRAKTGNSTVKWMHGGSSCADAEPVACMVSSYSIQPGSTVDHDWRCEIDATASFGSGPLTVRACDGARNPAVAIVVTDPSSANRFAPGIYAQQREGDTSIGPSEASYVRGGNLLVYWSELQPSLDAFSDSPLTWAMSQATWKNWILLVKTGAETSNGTPAWLTAASPSAGLGRPEHIDNIGTGPYPWDPVYQDLAENLMAHVASVVRDDTALAGAYIAGATSHYNEMILPSSADLTKVIPPAAGGLTTSETVDDLDVTSCVQYVEAWERAIDTMNSQFGVKIITPLDVVPACGSSQSVPYEALKATAATPYRPSTRAFGTVNLGYVTDLSGTTRQVPSYWDATPKFADRQGANSTSEYWELGPNKMSPGITASSDMAARISYTLGQADTYFDADAVTILEATWGFGTDSTVVRTAICRAVAARSEWWPSGVQPGC
jgi:hypothetical protein